MRTKFAGAPLDEFQMRALPADHCRIFAGFDAKLAARWLCGRFSVLGRRFRKRSFSSTDFYSRYLFVNYFFKLLLVLGFIGSF